MKLIDNAVLQEFRGKQRCELCGVYARNALQPHHAFARGHGGGNRLDHPYNLAAVCGPYDKDCHGKIHAGKIKRDDVLKVIANREGLTSEELLAELHAMMRSRSKAQDPLSGSGQVKKRPGSK
jgi:hypothetical protein